MRTSGTFRVIFSLIALLLFTLNSRAQEEKSVLTQLSTADTAQISILGTYPDSFPNIEVVFRAEHKSGGPLWGLQPHDLEVKENGKLCNVLSLEPVSDRASITVGLVIDQSSSMEIGAFKSEKTGVRTVPPIDAAKLSVKEFIDGFDLEKDFLCITGFSHKIMLQTKVLQDQDALTQAVDTLETHGATAFYDGLYSQLNVLESAKGLRVLIALTDGKDNYSIVNRADVTQKALEMDIPIYVVGLGEINKGSLTSLADTTNGQFFYARTANSLNGIYQKIRERVQSFYSLKYESTNLASSDSLRTLKFEFSHAEVYTETDGAEFELPESVKDYLQANEADVRSESDIPYKIVGAGAFMVLLLAGGTLEYKRRLKSKTNAESPLITSLYPNPTTGPVNIDLSGGDGILHVYNSQGALVGNEQLQNGLNQLDLSRLESGNYFLKVTNGTAVHDVGQLVLSK